MRMLNSTKNLIEEVGKKIGLSKEEISYILSIDKEHIFDIKLSSGSQHKAYRVQHKNTLGPYKGGIRFHPKVDLGEVRALSILMSLKTAAVGLPFGGGKGGVEVDPKILSKTELEELSKAYVKQLHPHLGPDKDVPAPDINTNSKIMDWMVEEYEAITNDLSKAAFTGKSIEKGGSEGREEATGRGGALVLKTVLEHLKLDKKPLTYALQGLGNVGASFGKITKELLPNLELVAATDSSGGISSAFGLDPRELVRYKASGQKLITFVRGDTVKLTNEDLVSEEVDILVLAALENSVHEKNAPKIKAKIIVELANGPVSDKADETLSKKGTVIVPDILANSGGVIVSYLEWLQNKSDEKWPKQKVNEKMERILIPPVKAALEFAEKNNVSLRHGALANALQGIIKARK